MAKYSFELKLKIVKEYLHGSANYKMLARQFGIADCTSAKKWVAVYQKFGEDGLRRSRQRTEYTLQFKQNAVELYLSSEKSYKDTALSLGMTTPALLTNWVSRYRAAGIDGLKPQRKGRRPNVPKPRTKENKTTDHMSDEQARYLKQLKEENLHLRIENAFLKEARRLRLAEEAQRRQRGLSTVSEENTD